MVVFCLISISLTTAVWSDLALAFRRFCQRFVQIVEAFKLRRFAASFQASGDHCATLISQGPIVHNARFAGRESVSNFKFRMLLEAALNLEICRSLSTRIIRVISS